MAARFTGVVAAEGSRPASRPLTAIIGAMSAFCGPIGPTVTSTTSSFTHPNARYPVCAANVFFYQSATGGRVFFDELGPPWPKHPCTDHARHRASQERITLQLSVSVKPERHARFERDGWTPLRGIVKVDWHSGDWEDREFQSKTTLLRAREARTDQQIWLALPYEVTLDPNAPVMARHDEDCPGVLEIESPGLLVGGEPVGLAKAVRAHPLKYDSILPVWFKAVEGDLVAICSLAWRHSFGCKSELHREARQEDLQPAVAWYRLAARRGEWVAFNNMGVMFRDGWGVPTDHRRAFAYFRRAARSGQSRALEHPGNCYRIGTGTPLDPLRAAVIDSAVAKAKNRQATKTATSRGPLNYPFLKPE